MSVLAVVLLAAIGVAIGAVGIGGFLVVPVLVFLDGRPVREAAIAATISFVGAGVVSLAVALRAGQPQAREGATFLAACAPGALLGALLLRAIDPRLIAIAITLAVGAAGVAGLAGWPRAARAGRAAGLTRARAAAQGVVTGTASALTGTSGPLVAMPLLAWSGVPPRARIRVGQIAQLPIALCAAAVFVAGGDIGWQGAAASALALGLGVLVGMRLAPRVAEATLGRTAALLMLLTACAMLAAAFA